MFQSLFGIRHILMLQSVRCNGLKYFRHDSSILCSAFTVSITATNAITEITEITITHGKLRLTRTERALIGTNANDWYQLHLQSFRQEARPTDKTKPTNRGNQAYRDPCAPFAYLNEPAATPRHCARSASSMPQNAVCQLAQATTSARRPNKASLQRPDFCDRRARVGGCLPHLPPNVPELNTYLLSVVSRWQVKWRARRNVRKA